MILWFGILYKWYLLGHSAALFFILSSTFGGTFYIREQRAALDKDHKLFPCVFFKAISGQLGYLQFSGNATVNILEHTSCTRVCGFLWGRNNKRLESCW